MAAAFGAGDQSIRHMAGRQTALDVLVVGLGAMGGAALAELARRGVRAAGVDRYEPPHTLGSSHGLTRIIREAYYEHPLYVPLVRRAYDRWQELADELGAPVYRRTGGCMIGPAEGELVSGALRSARAHGIEHEMLDQGAMARRFPQIGVAHGHVALLEARAGVLFAERIVAGHLAVARERGASVITGETVLGWEERRGAIECGTDRRRIRAARMLLCVGPWLSGFLASESPVLSVERQVVHWFEPRVGDDRFGPERCPVAIWEHDGGRLFYALPDFGDGVKVAIHHEGAPATPENVERSSTDDDERAARALTESFLPNAAGRLRASAVCLYTNTLDHHFLVDRHPASDRVFIVSPCSGHGFKFACVIGEIAADLALGERPAFDLSPFRLDRFRTPHG